MRKMNPITIATAYQAWLGYYNGALKRVGWSKEQLVANANAMAMDAWLAPELPGLEPKTVGKMGLKGDRVALPASARVACAAPVYPCPACLLVKSLPPCADRRHLASGVKGLNVRHGAAGNANLGGRSSKRAPGGGGGGGGGRGGGEGGSRGRGGASPAKTAWVDARSAPLRDARDGGGGRGGGEAGANGRFTVRKAGGGRGARGGRGRGGGHGGQEGLRTLSVNQY